jgi:tRNA-modifying protein YgfZ
MTSESETEFHIAHFADRGTVSVTGDDAEKFLQGLLTNDLALVRSQRAMFAGLLSPQGKILFDFIVVKAEGGFLLETARDVAPGLVSRLAMYKLRANVEVRDVSGDYSVFASWGPAARSQLAALGGISFADPRLPEAGFRCLTDACSAAELLASFPAANADSRAYIAHRIRFGLPEGGKDYAYGDTFPHEALFDQINGVSFSKGCYVGQEVVSRMEHRANVKKRVVPVVGVDADALPVAGTEVIAGDVSIGRLGSVADSRGLALLRLDRVQEFAEKGLPLSAGGVRLRVERPRFATFAVPSPEASP